MNTVLSQSSLLINVKPVFSNSFYKTLLLRFFFTLS